MDKIGKEISCTYLNHPFEMNDAVVVCVEPASGRPLTTGDTGHLLPFKRGLVRRVNEVDGFRGVRPLAVAPVVALFAVAALAADAETGKGSVTDTLVSVVGSCPAVWR